jgi:hypothetical protein
MAAWALTAPTSQASLLLLLRIFEKKNLFIHLCIILKAKTPLPFAVHFTPQFMA